MSQQFLDSQHPGVEIRKPPLFREQDSPLLNRPSSEVALLLDGAGRILRASTNNARGALGCIPFPIGSTLHDALHGDCDDADCRLRSNWELALAGQRDGSPVEWFFLSREHDVALGLRLQPAGPFLGALFPELLREYAACSVLLVRDVASQVSVEPKSAQQALDARIYQLRRASDPDPSLIASLDDRVRTLTARLLVSRDIERKQLASELHDGLGQLLSLLRMEIEGCIVHSPEMADGGAASMGLRRALNIAIRALGELREVTRNLRPAIVSEIGLAAAVKLLRADFEALMPDVDLDVDIGGCQSAVTEALAVAIYRIAQEALHNVARHAQARSATVACSADSEGVTLEICDDGVGLPQNPSAHRGLGLMTIRERALALGGSYNIESEPGKGCRIRIFWPVAAVNSFR